MTNVSELEEKAEIKPVNHQIVNLTFDCYELFKFIECIEKYTDEIELIFENREFFITFMDLSRIMICKCKKSLDNSHGCELLEKMKFGINAEDLMKLLRTRKTDKKEIELTFDNTKDYIQLTKTSEKYHSRIERTLNTIDLDLEDIPMDNLDAIEYPSKAKFSIDFLNDFFYEASIYSAIVEIHINDCVSINEEISINEKENEKAFFGVSFSEEGQIGESKYLIKGKYCDELKGNEKGSYAYSFLTPIKPLLPILTNSDITLNIKNDHPIKLELHIESLDIDMVTYLAPRVEEADFDGWNEDKNEDEDEF